LAVVLVSLFFFVVGCGGSKTKYSVSGASGAAKKIRIGYFANVTHVTALVGIQEKIFERYFANDKTNVEFVVFGAGTSVVEAMKGGSLDVSYLGPSPAILGYVSTGGSLLRIIAGAVQNGAQLVVHPSINSIADLKGKTIATPQLGNTQDVAARAYFSRHGLTTKISGGGDVNIAPTENATGLHLFKDKKIDGAWVPEPWASRLVLEGGGKVLVDEKTMWPNNKFLATGLVATTTFLEKYPISIATLLKAHIDINNFIATTNNVAKVKADIQAELLARIGKELDRKVLDRAWANIAVSNDPLAKALAKSADDASRLGLLRLSTKGLSEIFDLTELNKLLLKDDPNFIKYSAFAMGVD